MELQLSAIQGLDPDTLTGTSGAARIFGVGGAVLAQNQHYRQLHYLKLGRYDAEELS